MLRLTNYNINNEVSMKIFGRLSIHRHTNTNIHAGNKKLINPIRKTKTVVKFYANKGKSY